MDSLVKVKIIISFMGRMVAIKLYLLQLETRPKEDEQKLFVIT